MTTIRFLPVALTFRENLQCNIFATDVSTYVKLITNTDADKVLEMNGYDAYTDDSDKPVNVNDMYAQYSFLLDRANYIDYDHFVLKTILNVESLARELVETIRPQLGQNIKMLSRDGVIELENKSSKLFIDVINKRIIINPYPVLNKYKTMYRENRLADISLYEVLRHNDIKMYFDIENVPNDSLINDIVRDLIAYIKETSGEEITEYALTHNTNSNTHRGESYHLVLDQYYTNQDNIRGLVLSFIAKYPDYKSYMDSVVYSDGRLFKSINQLGLNRNPTNKHILVHGTPEQSIIQNIDGCKPFTHIYVSTEVKEDGKTGSWANNHKRVDKKILEAVNDIPKAFQDSIAALISHTNLPGINADKVYGLARGLKITKNLNPEQLQYVNEIIEHFEENRLVGYNLSVVEGMLEAFK